MKTVFSAGGLRPRRAAHATPAPGGQGGSSHVPERRVHQHPPVGKGAPAVRQSRAYIPCPRWAGDSGRASERRSCPHTRLAGGLQQRARARAQPRPPDTFLESKYPEMQRKRIPRSNEYQSRRGTPATLTRLRSPPAHRGQGM